MSKETIHIKKNNRINLVKIDLPASKSIANRALVVNALAGKSAKLGNISEARDTQTMLRLLASSDKTWDVLDAGTTMRFLTAYAAVTSQEKILTGTKRMQERPIKVLGDALKELGAKVTYEDQEGYPPVRIGRIETQLTEKLSVPGNISSQYISALLMIAPCLPKGLEIVLTGKIGSTPYIQMTLDLMKAFGVTANWKENRIVITPQKYVPCTYQIEPDWSAASYWYSFAALSQKAEITLLGLKDFSIQGDRKIAEMMTPLGVHTNFNEEGATLTKTDYQKEVQFNFTDCPDLAQTIAVVCAVKGIKCKMTGLESLRIKETDRIHALQTELAKFNAKLIEKNNEWTLIPADYKEIIEDLKFETYHDHRMAMAFAPLSTQQDIQVTDPSVVNKSYPGFWKDMEKAGFPISQL